MMPVVLIWTCLVLAVVSIGLALFGPAKYVIYCYWVFFGAILGMMVIAKAFGITRIAEQDAVPVAIMFCVIGVDDVFLAIAGAIKAVPIIDNWFRMLIAAWMSGQTQQTYNSIADAAAMASASLTDEDRFKASEMWRQALKRPRQLP